jgi:hypothetical protein
MPQQFQQLNLIWGGTLSLSSLLINLGVGVLLSLVLRWHFKRFGSALSNREELAQVFPLVLLTTVLIISIVKSSLALSLGLVGALSIVRFRTPIKEPEELAYLFISIGIGVGLGAGQTLPTLIAGLSILVVIAILKRPRKKDGKRNLHLSLDWQSTGGGNPDNDLERLNGVLIKHVQRVDLRRFDAREDLMEATYLVSISNVDNLSALVDDLRHSFPKIGVTFLDQNHLPSV